MRPAPPDDGRVRTVFLGSGTFAVPALHLLAANALVNVVCILVWAFSEHHGDFWPKWVLLGTLVMYFRRLGRRSRRRALPPGHER